MNKRERVREFVLANYLYGAPPDALDDDASFLRTGVMDSTGVMELIAYLEEEFGVRVEDQEFVPENLDSITAICGYLERKRREPVPATVDGSSGG